MAKNTFLKRAGTDIIEPQQFLDILGNATFPTDSAKSRRPCRLSLLRLELRVKATASTRRAHVPDSKPLPSRCEDIC